MQLQLSHTRTAPHPTAADTRRRQDDRPQHCIISAGLRQRTAARHVGLQHQQAAGGAKSVGLDSLSSPSVSQCHRVASSASLRLPVRQRISYKVAVITYKTRSTGKPAYLSDLLQNYRPARTLRSSDKLLLSVPRMALAFSAKVSVSDPSVWNSLSYQCRSAELFSSFRRILKTELFDIASSERKVCLVSAGMRL